MADRTQLEALIDHSTAWDWQEAHVSQAYVTGDDVKGDAARARAISINDIVESGTVLIAAGPADLDKAIAKSKDGIRIVPIGLVETAQIGMSKPLSRIFEIGSQLSYIIPGRTVGGISLSRVFFDGPSLLKALYMGEVVADYATDRNKYAKFASSSIDDYQKFANIGSGNLAMNLASSFFDQPCGLAFFFKDQGNDLVGQTYFEGCRVSSYNLGISANMNVLTEAVNMEFVRCRPINTANVESYTKGGSYADLNIVSPNEQVPGILPE